MERMARKTKRGNGKRRQYPRRLKRPLTLLGRDKGRGCERENHGRIDGGYQMDHDGRGQWSNMGKNKRRKKRKQQDRLRDLQRQFRMVANKIYKIVIRLLGHAQRLGEQPG